MKSRALCLPPGRAAPGMTLARAVVDRDGNVLLANSTCLDAEMLDRLIRRGVSTITVLVVDARDDETIAHDLADAEARVSHIFRGTGSAAREALRRAVLDFRLETTR